MTNFDSFNRGQGFQGSVDAGVVGSDYNTLHSTIAAIIGRIWTSAPVQVMAVTNAGGVSPVGFVDLLPLVNQIDGNGNAVPHGTIHQCPYQRVQGGGNAVIMDPQVGDIGVALFAMRDIDSAIANKGQANPGSFRRYNPADAIYLYTIAGSAPTQYMQYTASGITITSPTAVTINAPQVTINATTIAM